MVYTWHSRALRGVALRCGVLRSATRSSHTFIHSFIHSFTCPLACAPLWIRVPACVGSRWSACTRCGTCGGVVSVTLSNAECSEPSGEKLPYHHKTWRRTHSRCTTELPNLRPGPRLVRRLDLWTRTSRCTSRPRQDRPISCSSRSRCHTNDRKHNRERSSHHPPHCWAHVTAAPGGHRFCATTRRCCNEVALATLKWLRREISVGL